MQSIKRDNCFNVGYYYPSARTFKIIQTLSYANFYLQVEEKLDAEF